MENRSNMSAAAGTKLLAVREASLALANVIKDIGIDPELDVDLGRILAALDALEHVDSAVVQALVMPNVSLQNFKKKLAADQARIMLGLRDEDE